MDIGHWTLYISHLTVDIENWSMVIGDWSLFPFEKFSVGGSQFDYYNTPGPFFQESEYDC